MSNDKSSTALSTDISTVKNDNFFVVNNSNEIYKSNRLIESSYRLTTAQNRLLYMAMSKLKNIILDKNMNIQQVEEAIKSAKFDSIEIDVVEYKRKFNIKANNLYKELAKVATDLYNQEIIYFDEDDNIVRMRWVITCKYDNAEKGVSLQFHPDLIKDLLIFKNKFTRIIFDNFLNMKGKYSFRIYELCRQYLRIGHREFYIEDLRFKLGIRDEEYKTYSDLKRQVLNSSLKEINKITDLDIEFKEIEKDRKTRKVKKIEFNISIKKDYTYLNLKKENKQISFFVEDANAEVAVTSEEDENIINKLSDITGIELTAGDSETILMGALQAIDDYKLKIGVLNYIKEKMVICNKYSEHNIVKSPIGLIKAAIKENWNKNFVFTEEEEIRINGLTASELEERLL